MYEKLYDLDVNGDKDNNNNQPSFEIENMDQHLKTALKYEHERNIAFEENDKLLKTITSLKK